MSFHFGHWFLLCWSTTEAIEVRAGGEGVMFGVTFLFGGFLLLFYICLGFCFVFGGDFCGFFCFVFVGFFSLVEEGCLKLLIRSYCFLSLQTCSKVLFVCIARSLFQSICT